MLGGWESEEGGKLDYGNTSALTHWPYLLNALQKQLWLVHREWCSDVYMCVCVCMSLFHASHTGLRNKSPYYREEARPVPPYARSHPGLTCSPKAWQLFPGESSLLRRAATDSLLGKRFSRLPHIAIKSLFVPHIWELCAFDIIFPVETARNYGLRHYCGKITNCWLLRMKLSHMSSRALVCSLIYPATQEHTHILRSCKHTHTPLVTRPQ